MRPPQIDLVDSSQTTQLCVKVEGLVQMLSVVCDCSLGCSPFLISTTKTYYGQMVTIRPSATSYLVLGSMLYWWKFLCRRLGVVCDSKVQMLSLSAMTSRGVMRPLAQLRIIQAASNAPRNPRAHPDPVGQKGCNKPRGNASAICNAKWCAQSDIIYTGTLFKLL